MRELRTLRPVSVLDDISFDRPPDAVGISDEALEEINRLWTIVRTFSATAHDVNNALQVVSGSAELLEARDLEPLVRKRVEAMRNESAKAAAAIDRLLSYARMPRQASGRLDLRPLVDAAVSMRTASLRRMQITLVLHRGDGMPVWVVGEQPKIVQVLLDLLLMAEDRIAGQQARLDVAVTADAGFGLVAIEMSGDAASARDDGREEMVRVDGLTRHAQGWAAVRIAAAAGGRIDVAGSTLTLRWPA